MKKMRVKEKDSSIVVNLATEAVELQNKKGKIEEFRIKDIFKVKV